jgi:broad specificity phosphatase PhoE
MPTKTARPGRIIETPAPPGTAGAAPLGAIVIARHGEPALSRQVRLSAEEYRDWWASYEIGGILEGQAPPDHLKAAAGESDVIISSTRRRSIETAKLLADGREFDTDDRLIEAPLPPPPWPDWIKLSPRAWGVISRVWWCLGQHGDEESLGQARKRAADVARTLDELARRGEDVLVTAHGFFNAMIGSELRRLGWRCVKGRGYKYWSTRYFRGA